MSEKSLVSKEDEQEIKNSLGFRTIRSVLKKTFPFIVDVTLNPRFRNYNTTLFLVVDVDPTKLEEYVGGRENLNIDTLELFNRVMGGYSHMSLVSLINDFDKGKEIMSNVNRKAKAAHKSTLIPDEQKVPWWSVDVNDYNITPERLNDYLTK